MAASDSGFFDALLSSSLISDLIWEKNVVKNYLVSHHAEPVWAMLRDYLFDYRVFPLGVVPCLILSYFLPAIKKQKSFSKNLFYDSLFPLFEVFLLFGITSGTAVAAKWVYDSYVPFVNMRILDGQPLVLQVAGAFLISDFMFYFSHMLRHKIPWFWSFHAVHHSQRELNAMTTYRGHPVEGLISSMIKTAPIAFVGGSYPAWIWFSLINNFWGFFIHANIRTNLGPLKYIIVSPQFHRVHHSREERHFDMNYGERLVLWDWLFGTMYKKMDEYPATGVDVPGFPVEQSANPARLTVTWLRQMLFPFHMIYRSIAVRINRPAVDKSYT